MRSLLLSVFSLLVCSVQVQAQDLFFALLSGHQQVPSVATPAEHTVLLEISGDTLRVVTLDTMVLTSEIDPTIGAHIHTGYTGQNGPVTLALPFENIGTDGAGYALAALRDTFFVLAAPLRDTLRNTMLQGRAYINVHTLLFPSGEVRGQLVNNAVVDDIYDAMLYGDQENPGVLSDGVGGVLIELLGNQITVSGSFQLDNPLQAVGGTGAHLHIGLFGENGPVVFPLTPVTGADGLTGIFRREQNVFTLTAAQLDTLQARNLYVNIHSVAYPSGEIRGQVVGLGSNLYFSHVSYDVPSAFPNASARMRIMAEKIVGQPLITFSGSYAGWGNEITARTLRVFTQIANPFGGTALNSLGIPTRPSTAAGEGRVPLVVRQATDVQLDGLFQRYSTRAGFLIGNSVVYDNDFYHECKRAFYSVITPSQEVGSTPSRGRGDIVTEYYTSRIEVNGFISGLTDTLNNGGFHIHEGMAGENGPVVAPIDFFRLGAGMASAAVLPTFTIINLTPEQAITMKDRGFYYNLHTPLFPAGEVRGQITPRANTLYHAIVEPQQAGANNRPTEGDGAILIEADHNRMVATGSFRELSGFNPAIGGGAHLHVGLPGVAGPIRFPLATNAASGATSGDFLPDDNTFSGVTTGILDSLLGRQYYVNIHTSTAPSGEIRGQVAPLSTNTLATSLSPDLTLPYTGMLGTSRGTGRLVASLYDTTAVIVGSFAQLSSKIDTLVAGGAHMHAGTVAASGGILFPIRVNLGANDTAASVLPTRNVVALTPAQRTTLLAGNVYANVHTTAAGSGAIRGQMLMAENQYPDAVASFTFPTNGATIDLKSAPDATPANIDWTASADPDAEQDIAYFWQLYADTLARPVVQTAVSATKGVTLRFGQIDSLLASLGVAENASVTVFHRANTTDGSLITPSKFARVTFVRQAPSGLQELPAGAARLVNTLGTSGGHTLYLDVNDLPAGRYSYEILTSTGQRLQQASIDHRGANQRYEINETPSNSGFYFLRLLDMSGRASAWGFVIQ